MESWFDWLFISYYLILARLVLCVTGWSWKDLIKRRAAVDIFLINNCLEMKYDCAIIYVGKVNDGKLKKTDALLRYFGPFTPGIISMLLVIGSQLYRAPKGHDDGKNWDGRNIFKAFASSRVSPRSPAFAYKTFFDINNMRWEEKLYLQCFCEQRQCSLRESNTFVRKKYSVIIYSPSFFSKSLWPSFRTQMKIFWRMFWRTVFVHTVNVKVSKTTLDKKHEDIFAKYLLCVTDID